MKKKKRISYWISYGHPMIPRNYWFERKGKKWVEWDKRDITKDYSNIAIVKYIKQARKIIRQMIDLDLKDIYVNKTIIIKSKDRTIVREVKKTLYYNTIE